MLERVGRSKLIQTNVTEPDVELFMNFTKFGWSPETFDFWQYGKHIARTTGNKNQIIINDLSGTFCKSQKVIRPTKKNQSVLIAKN